LPSEEIIGLDRIDEDASFQVRPPGDLSLLATDLARLGQLYPIDVRPRGQDGYQVICGFRRIAALRFLRRDKVSARVHRELSSEHALHLALASAIHGAGVSREELAGFRNRLEAAGQLPASARDMLEKALATDSSLAPEAVEREVDADELAEEVAGRLGEINHDLAVLAEVFGSLETGHRQELLQQLKYSADLVSYLEGA
jgi:ParB-like chromosome segregation protein Spo0J